MRLCNKNDGKGAFLHIRAIPYFQEEAQKYLSQGKAGTSGESLLQIRANCASARVAHAV